MRRAYVLAIDQGTTGTTALVLDDGEVGAGPQESGRGARI